MIYLSFILYINMKLDNYDRVSQKRKEKKRKEIIMIDGIRKTFILIIFVYEI